MELTLKEEPLDVIDAKQDGMPGPGEQELSVEYVKQDHMKSTEPVVYTVLLELLLLQKEHQINQHALFASLDILLIILGVLNVRNVQREHMKNIVYAVSQIPPKSRL